MSLSGAKSTLETAIATAFGNVEPNINSKSMTAEQAQAQLGKDIADAIHAYTTSATVNIPALGSGTLATGYAPANPITGDTASGSGTLS